MSRAIVLGIDAANVRSGGGLTYLRELLSAAEPARYGIVKVVIWGGSRTLAALEDRDWLDKRESATLNKGLLRRVFWQRFQISKAATQADCDLLFVPGGSYAGSFRPFVAMSQNLLPFEVGELFRYGWSWRAPRLLLLRWIQTRSFRQADGVIFLTQSAKACVLRTTGPLAGESVIIPHGLHQRFRLVPKVQFLLDSYDAARPYRILYVSNIARYKHQWNVVEGLAALRREGFPLALDLVGPATSAAFAKLTASILRFDPQCEWVHYHGGVSYAVLHKLYEHADMGVFASSCENMPITLLETMGAGLPIACSERGPMPEILGAAGVYFDPERPNDIAHAVRTLIISPRLRTTMAEAAYTAAQAFEWERCADETFGFLARVVGILQRLPANANLKKR